MGNAYSVIWVCVIAVFLVLLVWRCVRRQQVLAWQQRNIYGAAQPSVQMVIHPPSGSPIPTAPPGYTPVLVNGQVVFQPIYAAAAAYPAPSYTQYSQPGTYASPAPGHLPGVVAAVPLSYYNPQYEQAHSFRLTDQPGSAPSLRSPASQQPIIAPSAPSSPQSYREEGYEGENHSGAR